MSAQILVIEDESEIRELISLLLLRQGHAVQQCGTAVDAMMFLQSNTYDLIVLDWMLPQVSGIDFLRAIKNNPDQKFNKIPVLMVTAKTEPHDVVVGLEAGADDYVGKPFESSIFLARVRALLRRSQSEASGKVTEKDIFKIGDLKINMASYEVFCAEEFVHLTPSEFKILTTMANQQGRVLTRDQLISVVQGDGISVTGRTIDTHVFGLRKKLGTCSDWIETIRGVGYRIKAEL